MKYLVLTASDHAEVDGLDLVLNNVGRFATARGQAASVTAILPLGQDRSGNFRYTVVVRADDAFEMKAPEPEVSQTV